MPKVLTETKHFKVTRALRSYIAELSPGSIIPPVRKLMEQTGGSHGTVIKALDALNNGKLIYRPAGRMSYVVAPTANQASARIAVWRPDYPSTNFENIINSVYHAAQRSKYLIEQHYYHSLQELDIDRDTEKCEAIMLLGNSETPSEKLRKALEKPRRPVILLAQHWNFATVGQVTIDDRRIGELGVEYLTERGHRKIMLVIDQPANSTNTERHAGWARKMLELGLLTPSDLPQWVFDAHVRPFADARNVTYKNFLKFLQDGQLPADCTAILTCSLEGVLAVMRALRECGIRVPEQISLIGFGGESDLGDYLYPRPTMIKCDTIGYGQAAMKLLEGKLTGANSTKQRILLPAYISEGDSVNTINHNQLNPRKR